MAARRPTVPSGTGSSGAAGSGAARVPPAGAAKAGGSSAARHAWREQFRFGHVKVLIACRGPIRLEALDAFERLGVQPSGILLSEKDSVVYPRALSPEVRRVGRNERVHRLPDYVGATTADKARTIARILDIAHTHRYTHVFAGYGFMAEDSEFIAAVERAGLGFVGPSSGVARKAGAKDAAKRLARKLNVSVTPGLDNPVALALLAQAPAGKAYEYLYGLVVKHGLALPAAPDTEPEAFAELVLSAAQAAGAELVTVPQLQQETQRRLARLFAEHPGRRFRLKHVAGGGGKGQRIVSSAQDAAQAVFEVLTESRALGPGDNRNFLIELNVESTRHNEVQLLGNGAWCLALGGRDCSLQMHEQKLLEVSITEELLAQAAQRYAAQGRHEAAEVLRQDRATLHEMEAQAERLGQAVQLDSASTFESIVDGPRHYFMEVNTRIQVEHRVTEMVYRLRFRNPGAPEQTIEVDSLVEAMLWLAVHGQALPRPERVPRHGSGVEARINATNDALRPHAGGMVLDWSAPLAEELRDDQGIGIRNPDTGTFMPYRLAGAYDSNAALIVTHGSDRADNFHRLTEILRVTELRGEDVHTNLGFHYGLLHWMLGTEPLVKPSTRFVRGYLSAVGHLKRLANEVDLDAAWEALAVRAAEDGAGSAAKMLEAKRTLVPRPLARLWERPHVLAGWLGRGSDPADPLWQHGGAAAAGQVIWRRNPLEVLERLYRHLRMEDHPGVSAEERIWRQDQTLLDTGLAFYRDLAARVGERPWPELAALLESEQPPADLAGEALAADLWARVRAAHRGHQLGLDLLKLPVILGEEAGFFRIRVTERLEVELPPDLFDDAAAAPALLALAPPPPAHADEIVAPTGGTFYPCPSPDGEPYVQVGQHVEAEDVVGLLEVMKMFNPVRAAFAATITAAPLTAAQGTVVRKGQPLFSVAPDHPPVAHDPAARHAARQTFTLALLARC